MCKISYETTAIADFDTIRTYFLEKEGSTEIADQIIQRMIKRIHELKGMPRMYRQAEYHSAFHLFTESGYLIFYAVNDDTKTIEIHHIFHSMRNIRDLLKGGSMMDRVPPLPTQTITTASPPLNPEAKSPRPDAAEAK